MIDGPVRPASGREGDELAKLFYEVRAAQATRGNDDDPLVLGLQEMPRERVADALPARRP